MITYSPLTGKEQACPDPESFRLGMEQTFDAIRLSSEAQNDDGCFKNSAEALSKVLELIRQHHVSLPGHICAVVVTTLVLEGWSNKLDPDHSVLSQASSDARCIPWGEGTSLKFFIRVSVDIFLSFDAYRSNQVQKMFEGSNMPWRDRMLKVVDNIMECNTML